MFGKCLKRTSQAKAFTKAYSQIDWNKIFVPILANWDESLKKLNEIKKKESKMKEKKKFKKIKILQDLHENVFYRKIVA